MQHYTIFFITVNALYVSGSFSTHHQELKNCTHSVGYMPSLLAATVSRGELELTALGICQACLLLPLAWVSSNSPILFSITNKMECYTIFFIAVNALHVSGSFSAHHQELKNCTHSIGYMPSLLADTANGSSKQAWHIADAVCTVFELLMMGRETDWNM